MLFFTSGFRYFVHFREGQVPEHRSALCPPGSSDDDPAAAPIHSVATRTGPEPWLHATLLFLLPWLRQLSVPPGGGFPARPEVRPGIGLRRADGGPGLKGAGSDRSPPQPLLPRRQRALVGHRPGQTDILPQKPDRRGPVHQQGAGRRWAGNVRHGPAGGRELRPVPERRSAGHRWGPVEGTQLERRGGRSGQPADRRRGSGLVTRSQEVEGTAANGPSGHQSRNSTAEPGSFCSDLGLPTGYQNSFLFLLYILNGCWAFTIIISL